MLVPETGKGMVRVLGRRISALRKQRGLSQAELANRLGISASAMGMYEQGRREPSAETLVALSRELQVTTDFLLTGKIGSQPDSEAYTRMVRTLVDAADTRLERRQDRPFSRQELAVLFAALLLE
jgi:transcriptional regulator with XRE-family HTH domain